MKRLLQPLWRATLVRRVLGALVLAFVLVSGLMLAFEYVSFRQGMAENPAIKSLAEALVSTLARIPDERDSVLVVSTHAEAQNTMRRHGGALKGDVLFQLRRQDGSLVYAPASLGDATLSVEPGRVAILDIAGQPYWTVQASDGPWRLFLAEPYLNDAEMLSLIGWELTDNLLLAFPVLLLPLWVAARRGMQPLSLLARRLALRDAHDLSPLDVVARHEELKPLVTTLDRLLAQLRQQRQRERAFVQDAAHELRTPLAAVAAQVHLLVHAPSAAEREQAGSSLDHALERASRLSRQLLDLAMLDEARPRPRQAIDLADIVQQALAHAAQQALPLGLELSLDAPEHLVCRLDRVAFESVLLNLLENGLRYVPSGGHIAVELQEADGVLRLTVADDGPGMSSLEREHAFRRFWRGHRRDDIAGSGLGLAIVREAAVHLGGSVHIEDGLDGRGVAFVLTVPIER